MTEDQTIRIFCRVRPTKAKTGVTASAFETPLIDVATADVRNRRKRQRRTTNPIPRPQIGIRRLRQQQTGDISLRVRRIRRSFPLRALEDVPTVRQIQSRFRRQDDSGSSLRRRRQGSRRKVKRRERNRRRGLLYTFRSVLAGYNGTIFAYGQVRNTCTPRIRKKCDSVFSLALIDGVG